MRIHSPGALALCALLSACGGGESPCNIASVQTETTNNSPKVGEVTHVGATPVTASGIKCTDVLCKFASSAPAIAAVDQDSGAVTAVAAGSATITAVCGACGANCTANVAITVRPSSVKLTLNKLGTGSGAVFASPTGSPLNTYDPGTNVTITATANPDSTFIGWGGACAGTASTDPCSLTMNADAVATATFSLTEKFTNTTFSADLGNVTSTCTATCTYHITAASTGAGLVLNLAENGGSVGGKGSVNAHISISLVAGSPCTTSPFDTDGTGSITGSDANLTANLVSSGGGLHFDFTGARNGGTITGSAAITRTLKDNCNTVFTMNGNTGQIVLKKQ